MRTLVQQDNFVPCIVCSLCGWEAEIECDCKTCICERCLDRHIRTCNVARIDRV